MSEAIQSTLEDRQAIEKIINGMVRLRDGGTRRRSPLKHCLRIAQCEEIISLCDELKEIAERQLVIKRDFQGTKSRLIKLYNKRGDLAADLDQLDNEIAAAERLAV